MAVTYDPIHWTPHKRTYDKVMLSFVGAYLLIFSGVQLLIFPQITTETLVIRATGTLAFLMLHFILAIGPLSRLNPRFLPLLYNRRHLGVTMFLIAATHGIFSLVQFHSFSNAGVFKSLFTSNTAYSSVGRFPFQSLGALALFILFFMAATSHDFWLKNLGARAWKSLHMLVYVAYAALVLHVMLGVIQLEKSTVLIGGVGLGMFTIISLHLSAGYKQWKRDRAASGKFSVLNDGAKEGFVYACDVADIPENRAKIILAANGEDLAIFKYDKKISAVRNRCKHQGGPLGEGKILDGCITCPWHGYQYRPHDGQSPPPFTEKVSTYDVKIEGSKVLINPTPYPQGTARPPAVFD